MKIRLDEDSKVHVVQRIIKDEKYFDKTLKFKEINKNEDQKDDNKENQFG